MRGIAEQTDEQFCVWMRGNLARAAQRFGLVVTGEPVWGWRLRSISAPATSQDGPRWLRVGAEYVKWIEDPDVADYWTGIPDSNAITGIAKPRVLASTEWDEPDLARRVRADAMTLLPGRPCSPTDALREPVDLPDTWWSELRRSIEAIHTTPTTRYACRYTRPGNRVREVFGDRVGNALRPTQWETTHGDLHWSNVLGPEFGLLDWELWGPGPVGADAATLYLFSLLVPEVSERIHDTFADVLDSPTGHIAQLSVAARILFRADEGDNRDLAEAVQRHIQPLTDRVLTS